MQGQELFGVVVRALGLWLIVQGFASLTLLAIPLTSALPPSDARTAAKLAVKSPVSEATSAHLDQLKAMNVKLALIGPAMYGIPGLILFFAANWFVGLAYRPQRLVAPPRAMPFGVPPS